MFFLTFLTLSQMKSSQVLKSNENFAGENWVSKFSKKTPMRNGFGNAAMARIGSSYLARLLGIFGRARGIR